MCYYGWETMNLLFFPNNENWFSKCVQSSSLDRIEHHRTIWDSQWTVGREEQYREVPGRSPETSRVVFLLFFFWDHVTFSRFHISYLETTITGIINPIYKGISSVNIKDDFTPSYRRRCVFTGYPEYKYPFGIP